MIDKFVSRLSKIGIKVELAANYPWVYLTTVNGTPVTETYMANHGFTAFFEPVRKDSSVRFSDRKKVFKMVRKMVNDCQDEF